MARRLVKPHPYPGGGAKIREARLAAGLCGREFGELVGSNKGIVSLWERELNCPSEAKMALIEKALGIELPRATRNALGRRSDGEKTCPTCGGKFVGYYHQKFCSPACWYATKPPKKRTCPVCNLEFEPGTPGQVYCSVACKGLGLSRKDKATACAHCGGRMPERANARQKYCSHSCASSSRAGKGSWRVDGARRIAETAGYAYVKVDGRWVPEHRVVMEEVLGRSLRPGENVHHKDGKRANNDPMNLELWIRPQPYGTRVTDMVERIMANAALLGLTEAQRDGLRLVVERELISEKAAPREKPYDPADDAKDITPAPSTERQRLLL
jgi:hypothetical protein